MGGPGGDNATRHEASGHAFATFALALAGLAEWRMEAWYSYLDHDIQKHACLLAGHHSSHADASSRDVRARRKPSCHSQNGVDSTVHRVRALLYYSTPAHPHPCSLHVCRPRQAAAVAHLSGWQASQACQANTMTRRHGYIPTPAAITDNDAVGDDNGGCLWQMRWSTTIVAICCKCDGQSDELPRVTNCITNMRNFK